MIPIENQFIQLFFLKIKFSGLVIIVSLPRELKLFIDKERNRLFPPSKGSIHNCADLA